jgi:hypothetical protein
MKQSSYFLPVVLFLAILALLAGLWAGLLRLGWALPSFDGLAMEHGPLMISGFLGTLIALERAVAIRQKWMFAVPVITGAGWISLLIFKPLGVILFVLGSLGTLAILGYMVRREPKIHTITMALGVLAWVIGNLLWLAGLAIYQMVFWWQAYLILTIGGERLELGRIFRISPQRIRLFVGMVAALLAGAALAIFDLTWGARLSGLAMLALSGWFLINDLAARNIRRSKGLPRFIAFCLYTGFIWLGIGGAFQLFLGPLIAGPYYDAGLHAVLVGFIISMIFGHAPIIFPAIVGTQVAYSPIFYIQPALLHLSLLMRIAGDLAQEPALRQWGGLLNEVAILVFLGMTVFTLIKGSRK